MIVYYMGRWWYLLHCMLWNVINLLQQSITYKQHETSIYQLQGSAVNELPLELCSAKKALRLFGLRQSYSAAPENETYAAAIRACDLVDPT